MTEKKQENIKEETCKPPIHVTSSPHLADFRFNTQQMMIDVLLGLAPLFIIAIIIFQWFAIKQVGLCILSCLVFEYIFTSMRARKPTLNDFSAVVTGVILGFSLPATAPWFASVIASLMAIGIGKVVFGGLGCNIFNPAMVGRAFVVFAFPMVFAPAAYAIADGIAPVTQATPLTIANDMVTPLWPMFIGNVNGSIGEVSALACLIGGIFLCILRTASWEIPVSAIVTLLVIAGIGNLLNLQAEWTVLHHLVSGAFLFGAFFIATDPVTSPISPKGKILFGAGYAAIVMLLRVYSNYPEGVMFAILLMNAVTPLLNKVTIPVPVGGPVPVRK